jgi:hypothetical protein
MKKIKLIFSLVALLALAISCTVEGISDDTSLPVAGTDNVNKTFNISTDNSGNVQIIPTADGATSFSVEYGHGTDGAVTVAPGGTTTHKYPEGEYTVKITTSSISGTTTEQTFPLKVVYRAPEDLMITTSVDQYTVKVAAKAKYANSFLVYFGDVDNEVGTPLGLEATTPAHTYAVGGAYTVKVVALSGGVAKTESTSDIIIYDPLAFPYTCELVSQNYLAGGTFGGANFSIVANPFSTGINTSAKVAKFEKPTGAEEWAGTWKPLDIALDFSTGTKIKMYVYATEVGKKIGIELQNSPNGAPNTAIFATTTMANQWEELVFDAGAAEVTIPADAKYKQVNINYNRPNKGLGEVIYIDNIRLTN